MLATSREPLSIDGEQVFRVPSLSLASEDAADPSDLAGSEAATLFVERARAHAAGFALPSDAVPLLAAICRHLDGMPLAIELAAARLRSMSIGLLHDRLEHRFALLVSKFPGAAVRLIVPGGGRFPTPRRPSS